MPLQMRIPGREEDYVNFDARGSGILTDRALRFAEDPELGVVGRVVSYLPRIELFDPAAQIELWEQLEWHRQTLLQTRQTGEPEPECVWEAKYAQTNLLVRNVVSLMEKSVELIIINNSLFYYVKKDDELIWEETKQTCPAFWLKEPENLILYRYANGHFPHDMDRTDIVYTHGALRCDLEQLMTQPHTGETRDFWLFRCKLREEMLAELKEMAGRRGFGDGLHTSVNGEEAEDGAAFAELLFADPKDDVALAVWDPEDDPLYDPDEEPAEEVSHIHWDTGTEPVYGPEDEP